MKRKRGAVAHKKLYKNLNIFARAAEISFVGMQLVTKKNSYIVDMQREH